MRLPRSSAETYEDIISSVGGGVESRWVWNRGEVVVARNESASVKESYDLVSVSEHG